MAGPHSSPKDGAQRGAARVVLWLVLLLSAVGGMVAHVADLNGFITAGFGLVALGCAAALIARHRKSRGATGRS
ncbi:hypothetical protein Skr01_09730 [Sphaerisporangium krabiense]|uniref:Uncharacterized protein n=1 Tax=Sphaerisporangium krabiense TaxID=763782 RepID=A0A7W8ZCR3_9ACTN|nr:hypothetical protein [Sphaerisporangium krabiense]MBB5631470.1 hypothetical protein [Sphaerisporangium krabiense]GII60888.1 hypothetical protein Skr01_09730 [Sphaerisporangium krabiense]